MKKSYLLLSLLFIVQWSQAQTVTIPDYTLRTILLNFNCADTNGDGIIDGDVDTNNDGLIQVSEAQAVTVLYITNLNGTLSNASIASIDGLEEFTNVTRLTFFLLDVLSAPMTNQNTPVALEELIIQGISNFSSTINLHGNTTIKEFSTEIISGYGTADFGNCPNLERVNVSQAINQFIISNCPNLTFFRASNNQITSIDLIGCPNISNFEMTNTSLESIDLSGIGLNDGPFDTNIYLGDNTNLRSLNIKNGSFDFVFIDNSPVLEYVCADEGMETETYTDHFIFNNIFSVHINTFCSFTPGGEYVTLEGNAILDTNTNGCDSNDSFYPSLEYQITDSSISQITIANASGDYAFYLQEDNTYTITPQFENPTYFTVSPTSITIDTSTASNPTTQDFCITPNGTHNDVEVTLIPLALARPGFDVSYKISYENKGNTTLSGTVQLMFDDDLMDLVSSNPMSDAQGLNTLSWNYTNLQPFETETIVVTMNLNSPTEVPAVNDGDILSFEASISPVVADETPDDNVFVLQQTVVNSFDPNDKRCLQGETVTTDYIGKFVHYMIRFENLGTASAVNVVVSDIIDVSKFDMSTLTPVTSSHDMITNIKNTNEVEFIFENINLPFDDANNDGYVVFKIQTLSTLQENDTFANTANIFFDFNAPIATNTAATLISNTLDVSEIDLITDAITIFPNPAKEYIQITTKQPLTQLEIVTIDGKLVYKELFGTGEYVHKQELSFLAKGIYLVKITTTKGTGVKKIVKQ